MLKNPTIKLYGWSGFSVEAGGSLMFFDPYLDFEVAEDKNVRFICVTHGHPDHVLGIPAMVERSGATVLASEKICRFLRKKCGVAPSCLQPVLPGQAIEIAGFKTTVFSWRHQRINYRKHLLGDGIVSGIKFAYNGIFHSPSFAPPQGFFISVPGYKTVLNYGEGFNYNMVEEEVKALGREFRPDIVVAGAESFFEEYVGTGSKALNPSTLILHHPHKISDEKFNVESSPPETFLAKAKKAIPEAEVIYAEPGFVWT